MRRRAQAQLERDETMSVQQTADDRHRLLVIANETLPGETLRQEVEYRVKQPDKTDVWVVSPALNTKVRHWTNEEEPARAAAAKRLDRMLANLKRAGLKADGTIGDDDPVQAIEDALRTFYADEVIVSTHPVGKSNWLEADVVMRARDRFPIPVTHVVVDLEREQSFVAERG
jgi:hypothetical protein